MKRLRINRYLPTTSLIPESCYDANFIVTGGNGGCHNNLRCRQWRWSWHHDNSRLSFLAAWGIVRHIYLILKNIVCSTPGIPDIVHAFLCDIRVFSENHWAFPRISLYEGVRCRIITNSIHALRQMVLFSVYHVFSRSMIISLEVMFCVVSWKLDQIKYLDEYLITNYIAQTQ